MNHGPSGQCALRGVPASVGQRHSRKWMDTRHSWQCALASLRWTASCSRSSYAWDVHKRSKPGTVHWPRCGQYAHISLYKTNVQINRELQDVHLTLRHSKDGQGRDRLLPSSWTRTVHKRGSRMEHSPPMLRQAQVRCCIVGSECQWRQERREPLCIPCRLVYRGQTKPTR